MWLVLFETTMALCFDEIGTKFRDQTLAFDFSECLKDRTRPRFNEVFWFLRMEMELEEGDVRSVGGHDSQKYYFVRMCNEERADQVQDSMRGEYPLSKVLVAGHIHLKQMAK